MEESKKGEEEVGKFFKRQGVSGTQPEFSQRHDFYSDLLQNLLKVLHISRGRVTCSFSVKPRVSNFFNGLHGGAVAAVAERVAIACAQTLVGEDKQLFLGELSISYLSAAPMNAKLIVDGSVVRSGRNLTFVSVEFRLEGSTKLVYSAQAILFNMAASKL